jgi:two-component system alkaline phosphatase synthesis response regulator PhoP
MTSELILLVDDEPSILQLLRMYLEREGFRIECVSDGEAAIETITRIQPALVILDLMLPKLDGYEVCKKIRARNDPTAILMLTARDEDIDKIIGLELGADDYLTKPFNPHELVARVKAILRRVNHAIAYASTPIHIGDLTIDADRRTAVINDQDLELRTQEFDLLLTLVENHGRVLSREQILQNAWGFDFFGQTRTVDVHIAHLRKMLASSRVRIETVSGIGYRLLT